MAPDISTRISIRWVPSPPSEPTDTIVLNVGSFFLDLRIMKEDGTIEWAMAGEKEVVSEEPLLCRWQKSLDSHGFPSLPDSGSFTQLPNGDSLETGSMPNPDRGGQVCEYEEIWRDLPIAPGSRAWIAKSTDSSEQGTGCWFGRVGVHFIALNKMAGKEFAARRLEFDGKWLERYEVGELEGVPGYKGLENRCFEGEERWVAGQTIKLQGREFVVLAVEDVAL